MSTKDMELGVDRFVFYAGDNQRRREFATEQQAR